MDAEWEKAARAAGFQPMTRDTVILGDREAVREGRDLSHSVLMSGSDLMAAPTESKSIRRWWYREARESKGERDGCIAVRECRVGYGRVG